jgi:hypothetical protein
MYQAGTRENAIARSKKAVEEYCSRKGLPVPEFNDSLRSWDWFTSYDHKGLRYTFTVWVRHVGDEKFYEWDRTSPNWRETYQDSIRVEWNAIERPHACPSCECSHERDGQETIIVP